MERFVKISRWAFAGAGLVLLFGSRSWFPDYYRPVPMGIISFGYSLLIGLPARIFPASQARTQFQVALALGLLLSGLGSLGLWGVYKKGIEYDKFVHFVFSGLMTAYGVNLFRASYNWPFKKAVWVTAAIVGASSVAWEFIEYLSNLWLHLGYFGQLFDRDSVSDLLSDLAGIIVALVSSISSFS